MQPLYVPFTKMHGAGNDFLVLDNRFFRFSPNELSALARKFCPRRFGVGADGLLALDVPEAEGQHYRMRYYNADGSLAGMCGNGARCLARFARQAGLPAKPLLFGSDAGLYRASVPEDPSADVRLFVPPPRGFREAVALASGETVPYINTGTHHTVVFVPDVDAVRPEADAPALRHDPAFAPEGTNVNYVEVAAPGRVRVRTFEKGVEGETLACGTGALAAALVAHLTGRTERRQIAVEARGGVLKVGFGRASDGSIEELYLEGPAAVVYSGTLELETRWLAELSRNA